LVSALHIEGAMVPADPTPDEQRAEQGSNQKRDAVDDKGAEVIAGDVDARRLEEAAAGFGRPDLPDSNWD
jgi:hypothetical protein